ncbi:hypothetical protein BABINDRAFT_57719 [Babjeviella inositovora NRRL Y-12698]|uniref:Mediator of RNA polymerase II transcription subunit 6 n=1 Tax=Babjeviella inositovora NRRL Y-12698 TaxID=984486 RepID=A0A1E3QV07_9ASCO|nr:uncharacterized protein BABINDRAFT_57719 [Babjeviella inositovora NRRL Y-12698]ODQ81414.1 hypothetical protein BABINDRAFT_57719 [Babjeviella inositovora NRRL Y-12698]
MADNTPLDELQWRSPEWIQAFGLRTDNILEYFSQSPFYDRTSNNQVLKMQSQFNENLGSLNDVTERLREMKGIEFTVAYVREPDFWIVRKQKRYSEEETETLADFYVIGANVYMAPDIHSILSSRLLSTVLSLRTSLGKLQQVSRFTPSQGHIYPAEQQYNKSVGSRPKTNISTPYSATPGTVGGSAASVTAAVNAATSSKTFDNLLNISLKNSTVYLEDIPLAGPGSTRATLINEATNTNKEKR